jgi:hypothetical protein
MKTRKILLVVGAALALGSLASTQLDKIIKVGGAVAVVNTFGKDINKAVNKLTGHKDTARMKTKVVTILSVGVNQSSAIGAAQVIGPPALVDKVVAVAQPEANLMGTIRIKALLPVSSKDVVKGLRIVEGVHVSGIVDIKL